MYKRDDIVDVDPRFDRPQSPAWKRAVLVALLAVLFWLAFHLRPGAKHQPKVTYATRYSEEFKFRPAASPVITERLKDGRVRLRGALPT
ncbi:hypothetical protein EV363DRAFT_1316875 [Boletus edulis]|uniref:Uncharacterized protein n=1 Tax=Boletus edulis BED1 TaxID=1328754 RepID=A0AAD4BTF3_BOLED|nr:hypothetical protein EV363DRAFT_1316875 [Boletus edulis]KAF8427667.1 hypothetical protein L210DRAFT_3565019 [Boletus edulis BED1]KAF8438916.1 hypothetical protein L210DRAFT_3542637 [Boletus edulis BED1]